MSTVPATTPAAALAPASPPVAAPLADAPVPDAPVADASATSAPVPAAEAPPVVAAKPATHGKPATHAPDVSDALQRSATQLADALGSGVLAASRSLARSNAETLESLLPTAPSPELLGADPLLALSTRLAAESDFWRRVGLRSLARSVIADRAGYVAAGLGVLAGLGLTVVAGLGGLFGAEHAAGKAGLLLAGAFIAFTAQGAAFAFTHAVRRSQREAANAAFARAEQAERRLHRIAVAGSLRLSDPAAFREALDRITS